MPLDMPAAIVSRVAPAPRHRYVLARPEHIRDAVRVGDVYVVPVFDGNISLVSGLLRDAGPATIPRQSVLIADAVRVGSTRARALRVVAAGQSTVLVVVRAPALREQCASCRTVHYFVTVRPR